VSFAGTQLKRRRTRRRLSLWRDAARDAGLGSIEDFGSAVRSYSGKLLVRLGMPSDADWNSSTEVEIAGPGLAPRLSLRPKAQGGVREVEVGEDDFDREVGVQGPPAVALAVLDAATRKAVRTLLRGPFEVEGHWPLQVTGRVDEGVLRIWVAERERGLPAVLRAGLALAARLTAPSDLAPRLASNLAGEPQAGVRRKILLTLLREFPEHQATRDALHVMRDDADAELRVRAGIALGAEGRDVLLEVAAGEDVNDRAGARAVAALGPSLALEEANRLLEKAARARRLETTNACVGVMGTHGSDATPLLAGVLRAATGTLAEAAAKALGATADAAAEAPLLRALAEGPLALRRAAAGALGRVGTRNAVAGLREAEAEVELRPTLRQAIARIHSRLAGAGHGQLSLSADVAGRLSMVEDESGRLSLSDGSSAPAFDQQRSSG
jgi:hypothetical protein